MHSITNKAVQQNQPIQQYHGKWPFWWLAGMQEPASVAFSLLNLYAYTRGAREVKRRILDGHPVKYYYLIWSFTGMNALVISHPLYLVFHTPPICPFSKQQANTLPIICSSDTLCGCRTDVKRNKFRASIFMLPLKYSICNL